MAAWKNPINARLYAMRRNMIARCHRVSHRDYAHYGGRGIAVCDEWRYSYGAFECWALASGYDPSQPNAQTGNGLSIDRIDNNGPYSPDNCRWATRKEQSMNRRNAYRIKAFGEVKTIKEWAKDPRCAVTRYPLTQRILAGIDPETAITFPRQRGGGNAHDTILDTITAHKAKSP